MRRASLSLVALFVVACTGAAPAAPTAAPDPDAAYARLIAALPPAIAATCERFSYTTTFPADPGELAQADCDVDQDIGADYVTYSVFSDRPSMDAVYDLLKRGYDVNGEITGPGCRLGPKESTWEHGRKLCYTNALLDDAWVMWTHEGHFVHATASRDDGDWAQLEAFWAKTGPISRDR